MRIITLKHLLIADRKCIGLQFPPDKVIHGLVKGLDNPRWSPKYSMVFVLNTKKNLDQIFSQFRGVAWVNCGHFFPNKTRKNDHNEVIDAAWFRKRKVDAGYIQCPESYL